MQTIDYAARLNAFRIGAADYWPGKNRITIVDLLERAASAGLNAADLNYPDHFDDAGPPAIRKALDDLGIRLNGLAMRYYTDPGFRLGAFYPSAKNRCARRRSTSPGKAIDALAEMGGRLMTLWMGQDGFDYSFQADYRALWDHTVEALQIVADHNPECGYRHRI